jgi:SAM-dependent methyltransferase
VGSAVVRCVGCDLSYLHPQPAAVDSIYEEQYFRAYEDEGLSFPTEGSLRRRYKRRLAQLKLMTGGGSLLEVGVGHGAFLDAAQQQGWNVLGVDVSRFASAYVQRTYGIHVHCGPLSEAGIPGGSIDVVHMSHVLEHLSEPVETLRTIRNVLRTGGLLAIEVPNELDELSVKLREIAGSPRQYDVPSTHLIFFTPQTLIKTVTSAGFVVKRCRTLRDLADGSFLRRSVKAAAALIERPFHMSPLIELLAEKQT